jgi:hypothetical protein
MPNTKLTNILDQHSVAWAVCDGQVVALDAITDRDHCDASEWINVTGWTVGRLYRWLGY